MNTMITLNIIIIVYKIISINIVITLSSVFIVYTEFREWRVGACTKFSHTSLHVTQVDVP